MRVKTLNKLRFPPATSHRKVKSSAIIGSRAPHFHRQSALLSHSCCSTCPPPSTVSHWPFVAAASLLCRAEAASSAAGITVPVRCPRVAYLSDEVTDGAAAAVDEVASAADDVAAAAASAADKLASVSDEVPAAPPSAADEVADTAPSAAAKVVDGAAAVADKVASAADEVADGDRRPRRTSSRPASAADEVTAAAASAADKVADGSAAAADQVASAADQVAGGCGRGGVCGGRGRGRSAVRGGRGRGCSAVRGGRGCGRSSAASAADEFPADKVAAAVDDVAAAAASAAAEVVDGAAGGRRRGRGGLTVLRAPLTTAFRFDISSKDHGHCHPKKSGFPDWSSRDEIRAKDPEARDA